jgi:hypothetical protein
MKIKIGDVFVYRDGSGFILITRVDGVLRPLHLCTGELMDKLDAEPTVRDIRAIYIGNVSTLISKKLSKKVADACT